MIETLEMADGIFSTVGNTPLIRINGEEISSINLYVKMESFNPTGSVKDRAATYIINKLLRTGEINKDTIIIESTSGNFGIALSSYCKERGLDFYCVIDPLISSVNETIINSLSTKVFKVIEPDANGGYLVNRIKKVQELREQFPNSYWINQYGNPYNAEAYYHTLGGEMCEAADRVDYVFVGVSSGGTITGVSRKIKDVYPNAKIIAVDIVGSVIFGGPAKKRYIPGIGSSKVPPILEFAKIDEVVYVSETEVVNNCNELLKKHLIFAGGSSGANFAAIKQYFSDKKLDKKPNVVTLFADRGDRYFDTIYNAEWCARTKL
ncbi:2,3-diaminopropionate biosynthesis protein SbnA [Paenibacillus tengchongensis]|uniref:2,3-diaminopropionate biosynthesis protein SbnA n=1 Tax=Paenibacillus tengchongensis TaxID=2608684 RepID=UPI001FEAE27D|nr:2,3-diaminopropionate biosynthesis protein SbnA [Paenibacillus tengchongensis]